MVFYYVCLYVLMISSFLIDIFLVSWFLINSLCSYRKTISVPNVVDLNSSNLDSLFIFEVWKLER